MLELYPNTFENFRKESKKGNVVPIIRSVLADLHTPVSAFASIAASSEKSFLFESIEGGEKIARYSFLASDPFLTVSSGKSQTIVEQNGEEKIETGRNLIEFLREHFAKNRLAERENLPPLCGGAVGFFGYGASEWFERSLNLGCASEIDVAKWMFFRKMLVFDHVKQRIEIVSIVLTDEAEGDSVRLRTLYDEAVAETQNIETILSQRLLADFANHPAGNNDSKEFESNWKKDDFISAIKTIKKNILAGICYQVVLSQRFCRRTNALPINIYRALRTTNPSPYMFYLNFGERQLIGASPEMLLRSSGQRLEYRPIAGTRKRGRNSAEDIALGLEMSEDAKEVSEHTMLVDLGRNDLGRVSEFGSVKVEELMKIEKYSHVQHLVTSLTSELRSDCDRFDALASCFPAGTVSGAPKVSAMKIINELEPTERDVYAGAVGYIDYAGNLDTCIAIRTISLENAIASIQAGAGIVADSIPESEYEETINKAQALKKAIEIAENFEFGVESVL